MSNSSNLDRLDGFGPASANEAGFALPAVLLLLMVLSTVSVFFLANGTNQQIAGRAMRESVRSFYATDAGLNMVVAEWDSLRYDTLMATPGDSVDLGSQTLENGATYVAQAQRIDDGSGNQLFLLRTRGRSDAGGLTTLQVILEHNLGFTLGALGEAAMVMSGSIKNANDGGVDGADFGPDEIIFKDGTPVDWGPYCEPTGAAKPGIIISDATEVSAPGKVWGDPPVLEQPWDDTNLGPYNALKASPDIVLGTPGGTLQISSSSGPGVPPAADEYGPRYNGDGTCDTTHPLNFGSQDPADACFNHWPVVLLQGDVELRGNWESYAQGFFVLDDSTPATPTHFTLWKNLFAGAVLGRGCVNLENGKLYGALVLDGASNCSWGDSIIMKNQNARSAYSSCVLQRALENSGFAESPGLQVVSGTWGESYQ